MNIGVYKITSKINKKCYIGSTSTIGFEKRWRKHLLDLSHNKHHSIYLQRAWNKYGKNNFIFEIIEKCSRKKCIKREQYYLDTLKPEYNLCNVAGSTLGYKFPKSYCNKLKKLRKGKNNPFYGKHHTKKTKDILKIRCINEGKENGMYGRGDKFIGKNNPFYGKIHSDETKKIIGEKTKSRMMISDKHPNFAGKFIFFHKKYGKEICGMCDLSRKYNLNGTSIWRIVRGKRKSHHGWLCLGKSE